MIFKMDVFSWIGIISLIYCKLFLFQFWNIKISLSISVCEIVAASMEVFDLVSAASLVNVAIFSLQTLTSLMKIFWLIVETFDYWDLSTTSERQNRLCSAFATMLLELFYIFLWIMCQYSFSLQLSIQWKSDSVSINAYIVKIHWPRILVRFKLYSYKT